MAETAAPAHLAQMGAWVAVGGGNSGIIGNRAHTTGYHRAGRLVSADDYSRRRDPAGPGLAGYSGNGWYACAGDYHHGGRPVLRARHAVLITRLMDDDPDLGNVCEFIGQPWPDKPVIYWARWNGARVLRKYTGPGHTDWSHISVWRSDADREPRLWASASAATGLMVPVARTSKLTAPTWRKRRPDYYRATRWARYDSQVRAWQARMRQRGWKVKADGYYGDASAAVCRKFQAEKGLGADGLLGPITFRAAWTAPVT